MNTAMTRILTGVFLYPLVQTGFFNISGNAGMRLIIRDYLSIYFYAFKYNIIYFSFYQNSPTKNLTLSACFISLLFAFDFDIINIGYCSAPLQLFV